MKKLKQSSDIILGHGISTGILQKGSLFYKEEVAYQKKKREINEKALKVVSLLRGTTIKDFETILYEAGKLAKGKTKV